jgi:hypothetical protein
MAGKNKLSEKQAFFKENIHFQVNIPTKKLDGHLKEILEGKKMPAGIRLGSATL